jgi:UDP-N-acetyl-D-glucosamine dehydrogenase
VGDAVIIRDTEDEDTGDAPSRAGGSIVSATQRLQDLPERIRQRQAEVAVLGLGYVGLPLALAFAQAGFRVVGIDINAERVSRINAGNPDNDDIPAEALRSAIAAGRFRATDGFSDLARVDCINICVPTPLRQTKEPDVSFIMSAVEEVKKRLRSGQLIVLGSTTYPGTTHELYLPLLEESGLKVGEDFALAFAPERIDPANKQFALRAVPKVVGGETPLCTNLSAELFRTIFDSVVPVSDAQTAEMVKLLENTFRMINIGLANEVAMICDKLGLDVWEVIEAAATKPYGYMKFVPGPGLGGHCIPVDPVYLSWKLRSVDFPARFIDLASEVNQAMPAWVVQRVQRQLNRDRLAVNGAKIVVLGVAYKADVGDPRESPAIEVIAHLEELGAEVTYCDSRIPQVDVHGRLHKAVPLSDDLLRGCDLALIVTAHSDVDYRNVCELAPRVFDARNATQGRGILDRVERL